MRETKLSNSQNKKFRKFKRKEMLAKTCYDYQSLANSVSNAGDKDWARKLYEKAEELAEDLLDYCTLAHTLAGEHNLCDKERARKLLEKADELVATSRTYAIFASFVGDRFGYWDKDWARKLFKKAEELAEDSEDYWYLARIVANKQFLGDEEWALKLNKKAEELAESSDDYKHLAIDKVYSELSDKEIMSDKFKNVPLNDETEILSERIIKLGDFEALFQNWSWGGITSQSIIFTEADAEKLSDDLIEKLIRTLKFIDQDAKLRISRSVKGYTFVNFTLKDFSEQD